MDLKDVPDQEVEFHARKRDEFVCGCGSIAALSWRGVDPINDRIFEHQFRIPSKCEMASSCSNGQCDHQLVYASCVDEEPDVLLRKRNR